jgi:hypothetical protein
MARPADKSLFRTCATSNLVVAILAVNRFVLDSIQNDTKQILALKLRARHLRHVEGHHPGAHDKEHSIAHIC